MHREKSSPLEFLLSHLSFKGVLRSLRKIASNLCLYLVALLFGGVEVILFFIKRRFLRHGLPNYHSVVDKRLYRGGQPSNQGLRELAKQGIRTIINLRIEDFNKEVIEEYKSHDIRTVHLPFSPYDPQDRIFIEFLKIMGDRNQGPAFVHCFHGADRTGAVVAIYRIIMQNWDKEKAIAEMKLKGLHWWHKNLIRYIKDLDVESIKSEVGLSTS
jgi:tyrosine-protein phosphatase SIW14